MKGIDARNTQQNDTTPHKYLIICRNYNKSSENLVPYNAIRRERCAEFSNAIRRERCAEFSNAIRRERCAEFSNAIRRERCVEFSLFLDG
ncbi:hypothetical protein LEP1GSC089_1275 [Leptospira interrogans serovar Autumnalis str. LP101]|nr:hypothetical protein LEP1GSC089_1275 [Leptospira interrogans serovar Autumnalis str. LP101]